MGHKILALVLAFFVLVLSQCAYERAFVFVDGGDVPAEAKRQLPKGVRILKIDSLKTERGVYEVIYLK